MLKMILCETITGDVALEITIMTLIMLAMTTLVMGNNTRYDIACYYCARNDNAGDDKADNDNVGYENADNNDGK